MKTKLINNFTKQKCRFCSGKGCTKCNDGIYIEKSYIIVAKTPKGQQIAFQAEFGGK